MRSQTKNSLFNRYDYLLLGIVPLFLFFGASIVQLLILSFYEPDDLALYREAFTIGNYRSILSSIFQLEAIWRSLWVAAVTTVISLVLAYPVAFHMARYSSRKNAYILILGIVYGLSFVLKVYAWQILFAYAGPVNVAFERLRIVNEPLQILGTLPAIIVGSVYANLPPLILVLFANFEQMSKDLEQAAGVCGAPPHRRLLHIILPLSISGLGTGLLLILPATIAAFTVPMLLGQGKIPMIATQIYTASQVGNWPLGAALSVVLLVLSGVITLLINWAITPKWMGNR